MKSGAKANSHRVSGVRNFRTPQGGVRISHRALFTRANAKLDFFQMAITSSFQIQIEHRLKLWTPDFPSFETTCGIHEMDFGKCSKSGCHDCHQECFFSHHVLSLCEKFALSVFMVRNSTESFAYAFWLPCFLCFTSISIFASIVPA